MMTSMRVLCCSIVLAGCNVDRDSFEIDEEELFEIEKADGRGLPPPGDTAPQLSTEKAAVVQPSRGPEFRVFTIRARNGFSLSATASEWIYVELQRLARRADGTRIWKSVSHAAANDGRARLRDFSYYTRTYLVNVAGRAPRAELALACDRASQAHPSCACEYSDAELTDDLVQRWRDETGTLSYDIELDATFTLTRDPCGGAEQCRAPVMRHSGRYTATGNVVSLDYTGGTLPGERYRYQRDCRGGERLFPTADTDGGHILTPIE